MRPIEAPFDQRSSKDAIQQLQDQVDYLRAQLIDTGIVFPSSWRLRPSGKILLRAFLKRGFLSTETARAVLWSDRHGDEPDDGTLKAHVWYLRQALGPLGITIITQRHEGYSLSPEMSKKIRALVDAAQGAAT